MTIFSKILGGPWPLFPPLATPMQEEADIDVSISV